jgi:hypothetical protein
MEGLVYGSLISGAPVPQALDPRVILGALVVLGCLGYLIARDESIVEFRCLLFSWRRRPTRETLPASEPKDGLPSPAQLRPNPNLTNEGERSRTKAYRTRRWGSVIPGRQRSRRT